MENFTERHIPIKNTDVPITTFIMNIDSIKNICEDFLKQQQPAVVKLCSGIDY